MIVARYKRPPPRPFTSPAHVRARRASAPHIKLPGVPSAASRAWSVVRLAGLVAGLTAVVILTANALGYLPKALEELFVSSPATETANETAGAVEPPPTEPPKLAVPDMTVDCTDQGNTDAVLKLEPPAREGHLQGIDASHFNKIVPWKSLREAGVQYTFLKATESNTITDSKFAQNWAMTKECGVLRGAYHFFHPTAPGPLAQAKHFLSVVPADDLGELPLVLDVEQNYATGIHCEAYRGHVQSFVDYVYHKTGRRMMIYAGYEKWNEMLCNTTAFSKDYLLWVPKYDEGTPLIPGGWPRATFWQYSATGSIGGEAIDLDQFKGDVDDLIRLTQSVQPRFCHTQEDCEAHEVCSDVTKGHPKAEAKCGSPTAKGWDGCSCVAAP
jgi:GH25 family lysozyme M1 (1,4-beta-N-acetylmuramidase)